MTTWPNIPPRFRHKINGAVRSARPAPKTEAQREIEKAKREEHERALETQLIVEGIGHDRQVKMLAMFGLVYFTHLQVGIAIFNICHGKVWVQLDRFIKIFAGYFVTPGILFLNTFIEIIG